MISLSTQSKYRSWGNHPVQRQVVVRPHWPDQVAQALQDASIGQLLLPRGLGRSYGDSCINETGVLLDATALNRVHSFDTTTGILRADAGISLEDILAVVVPHGWFLPVTPGTKYVTLAGAIANDVHGKNHHKAGTFSRFVRSFELLRSDGHNLICSPETNSDWFTATVGGLGLTGFILWAEVQLVRIQSPFIDQEVIKFDDLEEFFRIADSSDHDYAFTVAWIDSTAKKRHLGRGHFIRGNHCVHQIETKHQRATARHLSLPFELPSFVLNSLSIGAFNKLYYNRQGKKHVRRFVHYEPFFYPLDAIDHWNRMYGRRGFFQYQSAIPKARAFDATKEMLELISNTGTGSFLSVLKLFGALPSPGLLSFPIEGVTLALDFPNLGQRTLGVFEELDEIVGSYGGRVYPAKDQRMSAARFKEFFPNWKKLEQYRDPAFSSSFWRRVTA